MGRVGGKIGERSVLATSSPVPWHRLRTVGRRGVRVVAWVGGELLAPLVPGVVTIRPEAQVFAGGRVVASVPPQPIVRCGRSWPVRGQG